MRTDLPTGTVTFLFTDVEGSTKLLHELGAEAYAEALADHRRVIREACAAEGGIEVDTQGDAFFFAFPTAPGAVAAAEAMTAALADGPIQVRIGLHTGTPLLAQEGYVGGDVHRAARIAAVGFGGQVLVSASTAQLVEQELTDLGEHRLKDLSAPERLFQLGGGAFPPLKVLYRTNLPVPATPFLGRERELEDVLALLDTTRLLTLTGPGGTGKTRLALQAAAKSADSFPDGVYWVPLASLRDPDLVLETAGLALETQVDLDRHIADKRLLLLLDNFEQVVEAAPRLGDLVRSCPNLVLMVTSRELLRIAGELEYAVPPLAQAEAVALFCERSQLEPDRTIADVCRRLDDMPLAVELAAARTRALTPEQILDRLSQRLDLLKGGRDADPRQQTLRAAIEWSYELLTPEEQQLFARLSLFAGGCTLEAAEEVCDADIDTLQSLVEKSLLRFNEGRYWMLETIREYADGRLDEAGGRDAAQRRYATWIVRLGDEVGASRGIDTPVRKRFTQEQDNFRRALAWAQEEGHADVQFALIGRTWLYWWDRGNTGEGLRWVDAALSRSDGERTREVAEVLAAGAMFAARAGNQERLKAYADESLAIARERGDRRGELWPLNFLGMWEGERSNHSAAERHYEEAIALAGEMGDRELVSISMINLGVTANEQGDIDRAASLFDEARRISRELGALEDSALATLNLAECHRVRGRIDEAAATASEGLSLVRELETERTALQGLLLTAVISCARGEFSDEVARLVGAADALRDRLGESFGPDADLVAEAEKLEVALGLERYARALEVGRAMPLDAAVDAALASLD